MSDPIDLLIEFLRARLNEREQAARQCAEVFPSTWEVADRGWTATVRADEPSFHVVTELDQSQVSESPSTGWLGDHLWHIAYHEPARVLRDVEAKRRIVDAVDGLSGQWYDEVEGRVLKLLASVYADHPDYREEWAP